MLRFLFLVMIGLLLVAEADARGRGGGSHVSVRGYVRSDGTYVRPHYRTSPNGTASDNWSTVGNVNPYTGRVGTKVPYGGEAHDYEDGDDSGSYEAPPSDPTPSPPAQPLSASSPSDGYGFKHRYETNLRTCLKGISGCDMDLVYNEDIARVRAARSSMATPSTTSNGSAFKTRYESNLQACLGGWANCDMDLVYNEDIKKVRDARRRLGFS